LKILITGIAGFIGMHIGKKLLNIGHSVYGIDSLNDYYDVKLKKARLNEFNKLNKKFTFKKLNICNKHALNQLFKDEKFSIVVNLAAQAGVRFSITNPDDYIKSNVSGFLNILECCKNYSIKHLVFASSSSVYGSNEKIPFLENDNTDHPISLYGATKKSNELMAHTYSSLYKLPTTGLRFFTVYGPWGRPDMAPYIFTKSILSKDPIKVFNNGNMKRDFTYIDDIINALSKIIFKKATSNQLFDPKYPLSSSSNAPYRIFNIGNSNPVKLTDFIKAIEKATGEIAIIDNQPMQLGDVKNTFSNTDAIEKWISIKSKTNVNEGILYFVDWYKKFYKI